MFAPRYGVTVGSAEFQKVMKSFEAEKKVVLETRKDTAELTVHEALSPNEENADLSAKMKQRNECPVTVLRSSFQYLSLDRKQASFETSESKSIEPEHTLHTCRTGRTNSIPPTSSINTKTEKSVTNSTRRHVKIDSISSRKKDYFIGAGSYRETFVNRCTKLTMSPRREEKVAGKGWLVNESLKNKVLIEVSVRQFKKCASI